MKKPLKISIVEDDRVIQDINAMRVAKLGHTVHSRFNTGESALLQLPGSLPDIVLMDIDLGDGIDGIETALRLQEKCSLPVVFVTAHREEETLTRVKRVAGAEYIVKPFTDDGLRIAIDLALDKYQALCETARRQELQEMLLNRFFGAIIATDRRGIITYINEQGRSMLKWAGPINGITHFREIVTIIDGSGKAPLENVADRILSTNKIYWLPDNACLVALDKTQVPVLGSASPVADATGAVAGMIVVLYQTTNPMYLEYRGRPLY